jgi:hypothetical protein
VTPETLVREWDVLTSLLPPGWRELAHSTGAMQRSRKVADASTLLLLILLHVAAGLSLVQAAARARHLGLADLSPVALHKRLRAAGVWLHALAAAMYAQRGTGNSLGKAPQRRIRVVDATTVREPGSTGTNWRLHYVLQLPSLECDFFEITDASGGESYRRLPIEPGDLILGDRAYARLRGVAHVLENGGDVVVRLNSTNFPLFDGPENRVQLLECVRTLVGHEPADWDVNFTYEARRYPARLCAIRKSEAATEKARASLLREARKKGQKVRPQTLELAGYVLVLTTLRPEVSTTEVLRLYRARWQIELAFKRMKSLFDAGHVPKRDPETARAWLHAKLLAVLLMERLGEEARLFSPWGFPLRAA